MSHAARATFQAAFRKRSVSVWIWLQPCLNEQKLLIPVPSSDFMTSAGRSQNGLSAWLLCMWYAYGYVESMRELSQPSVLDSSIGPLFRSPGGPRFAYASDDPLSSRHGPQGEHVHHRDFVELRRRCTDSAWTHAGSQPSVHDRAIPEVLRASRNHSLSAGDSRSWPQACSGRNPKESRLLPRCARCWRVATATRTSDARPRRRLYRRPLASRRKVP
jgi:hypothetical protein